MGHLCLVSKKLCLGIIRFHRVLRRALLLVQRAQVVLDSASLCCGPNGCPKTVASVTRAIRCLWARGQRIRGSEAAKAKLAKSLTKAKSKEMGDQMQW